MSNSHFSLATDADGIATLTWDSPNRNMNVFTLEVIEELEKQVAAIAADEAIKGCVITSGKESFSGGADLTMLASLRGEYQRLSAKEGADAAMKFLFTGASRLTMLFRKLETCGKPFAAAVHGTCVGGAFELALSCQYRVCSSHESTRVGLPEIKVGLFPGAGGTQRVARLMQTGDALQFLFKGEQMRAPAAKGAGLIHAVVPREEMIANAKEWLKANPKAKAPWDTEGYKLPSNKVHSPAGMMIWPPANAIYRRETHDNYPAAKAILQSVYEGLQLPMDLALRVEARYFTKILNSREAAMMIRSLFLSKSELEKGARRPAGVPKSNLKKIAVLGAGFMGAAVAYVSASAGLEVVLLDRDQAAADKGKDYAAKQIGDQIMKGRAKSADREALLSRITATADYNALSDCQLVIEAVFEDKAIKAEVVKKAEAVLPKDAIFASNTSTLPISMLAEASSRADQFVGIHFFSPVEKMLLVEVIKGKKTGDRALATALDYIRIIKKTPIVVNDSRGFYTSRVVGTYVREGHQLLLEGVPPAMIENLGKAAGMPVGPLSLNDEVAIDLAWKILQATKKDLGAAAVDPAQENLLNEMVVKQERFGRKNGKGFYDYAPSGEKKLWPGLAALQPVKLNADSVDREEVKQRLLVIQALETARTFEEGCLTDVREADVGSILGFGFAPFSGGTISYIDGMGVKTFVTLCEKLAKKHGPRFAPNKLLKDMAKKGESFYGRFAEMKQAA